MDVMGAGAGAGAGRRCELFDRVYEWQYVAGRWSLELVWSDEEMDLIQELLRAVNAESGFDPIEVRAALQRLNDIGNTDFGEASSAW